MRWEDGAKVALIVNGCLTVSTSPNGNAPDLVEIVKERRLHGRPENPVCHEEGPPSFVQPMGMVALSELLAKRAAMIAGPKGQPTTNPIGAIPRGIGKGAPRVSIYCWTFVCRQGFAETRGCPS